ncbi:MAG TPA: FHA domain-containing protein [Kofleriaceae bacterium]|nr:FHA domain-containing protein [Kofleriaceae bacterium]
MYRDSFEKCPRCGVELVDARSARGCRACGGLWVEEAVLTEMILAMLPPRPLSRLTLAVIERVDAAIGCPTCGEAMEAASIHEVSIDRCGKHGIWFDALELQTALHRVADPELVPPLELLEEPPAPWEQPRRPPPEASRREVELAFHVRAPGQPVREVRTRRSIVKIGKVPSSTVLIEGDERVSRIHAIIEVNGVDDVVVIDLGSEAGTSVNGEKINKRRLRSGDELRLGDTLLHLTIAPPPPAAPG